jgi:hypothetical protein
MSQAKVYVDLKGRAHSLADLDDEERRLVKSLIDYAAKKPEWSDYCNHWMAQVGEFYDKRGVTRLQSQKTVVYRVAQDLGGRLMVAQGAARAPDYRDDLQALINASFDTRRQFCEATGISETMLSHVLAKRKHVAIDSLVEALHRIGYTLHITPLTPNSH